MFDTKVLFIFICLTITFNYISNHDTIIIKNKKNISSN